MEKFQELREIAWKKIQIADHMLTQTFPTVQDPKILLSVLESLFLAFTAYIDAVLEHERVFKKVPPYPDSFDSKFNLFQRKVVPAYKIGREYIALIEKIKELLMWHRKSPIEFTRNDRIVICEEDYKMRTISVENVKEYIFKAKEFGNICERITKRHEEIFKRGMQI
jgi:hypothetical protein